MTQPKTTYEQANPYMTSNMYNSSFMSDEGSNTIQTLIGTRQPAPAPTSAATAVQYNTSQPAPQGRIPVSYNSPAYPPPSVNYTHQYPQQQQQSISTSRLAAASANPYPQSAGTGQYTGQPSAAKPQYGQYASYSQQQTSYQYSATGVTGQVTQVSQSGGQVYANYSQPPPGYTGAQGYAATGTAGGGAQYGGGGASGGGGNRVHQQARGRVAGGSTLTPVRITGRQQHRR